MEETAAPVEPPAEPPKDPPKKAPRSEAKEAPKEPLGEAPKAAVDFKTFDQGWNQAIDQAAATAKAAVKLGNENDNGVNAELLAEILLGLKRVDTQLHEEEITHTLRSDSAK